MRPKAPLSLAALLAAALLAAWPTPARAGGFTITIIGGRRTGMMTNLAAPDDLTALFHNPAGLADQPGVRAHLSTSATFLNIDFSLKALDPLRFPLINPEGCGAAGSADPCPWPIDAEGYYARPIEPERYFGILPYGGVSTDLGFLGPRGKDVVVSFALYSPDFYGAFLPKDAPTAYHIIDGFFMVIAASAGAGWKVNRYLSVGAALSYHYMNMRFAQKLSVVDMLTPYGAPPDSTAQIAAQMLGDFRLDYNGIDHGVGWDLGVLVRPTRWLTFGFNYNGATAARFSGDLELSATNPDAVEGVVDAALAVAGLKKPSRLEVEMPIPHAVMAGVNADITRWFTVAMDFRLWLYTLYKEQVLRPIYEDDVLESEKPLTEASLTREKDYNLSYELGLGFLVRPGPLLGWQDIVELMAGVAFDRTPIPGESFSLDNPALSQIAASVGVRALLWQRYRLSATYLMLYYIPRDVQNSATSPATNARGTGIAHIPGVELEVLF